MAIPRKARLRRQNAVSLDTALGEQLRSAVELETGMDLSGSRLSRLQDAAEKLAARQQWPRALDRVLTDARQRAAFLERLCAELTIGESFFLRNGHHFQALRECVLPTIIREKKSSRELRIWSAGCATGEEPYSVALLLHELLPDSAQWDVHILGTDLNPGFLAKAREARYGQWSFRGTDVCHNRNYFTPEGKQFRLQPHVRQWVRFSYLNLVKDVYPSPLTGTLALDLILFRNVAIYLKKEVTQAIIGRFHRALRPGGWLLLGETELNIASADGFNVEHIGQATFHHRSGDHHDAPDRLPEAARPVLVDAAAPARTDNPVAEAVPEWVPLPARRSPDSSPPAADCAQQIEHYATQGDFAEAERIIGRVVPRRERSELALKYARLLLAQAEVARAHDIVEHCLRDEPLSIEAHLLKGSFAEEDGDLDAAEQAYRHALYIDRMCPIAHFHLGLVQQQKGDNEAATQSFQLVQTLTGRHDPHAVADYGEGVCYGRLQEMAALLTEDDS